MRSKPQLCTIMRCINPHLYPDAAYAMKGIADLIEFGGADKYTLDALDELATNHGAEYINELAKEALHYLGELK